jgi:hypothetical protein
MKITPQSEQYGIPGKTAREIPSASEISELLAGYGTTPGYMSPRQAATEWDADE